MSDAPSKQLITSREYKVMLDARMFDSSSSMAEFSEDLSDSIKQQTYIKQQSKEKVNLEPFRLDETHRIRFLETDDNFFNKNQLLLRERRIVGKKAWQLTLKSRSPDYYTGFRIDLRSPQSKEQPKFEEDIGPPFISKFSQSMTLSLKGRVPSGLKEVSSIFPVIQTLPSFDFKSRLEPVNCLEMIERVFKGPQIKLGSAKAEFALILWQRREKGRTSVAEFSFRYRVKDGEVDRLTSLAYASLFHSIQGLEWYSSDSRTKTQYMYQTNRSE